MRNATVAIALVLSLLSGLALADPHKDESGHNSRERAAEAEREYWKRQDELVREDRKRWEEAARERQKREEEWRREEWKRAREWEREHWRGYEGHSYEPYYSEPAYLSERITRTADGIGVWLSL